MSGHMTSQNQSLSWTDSATFRSNFTYIREIASGTEGTVGHWENLSTNALVAVKTPRHGHASNLQKEISAFKKIPPHTYIVRLLAHDQDWKPFGPALFFELAELGDVNFYRTKLKQHYGDVPEMTLWKFLRDMSLGMDWVHNHSGETYVHGDLKPENVLVFSPPGWNRRNVPLLPTFKICDISRMMPLSADELSSKFRGTYEFGPPHAERQIKQTPAVDVYSIGASLQWFALGIFPVMSNTEFMKLKREEGGTLPSGHDMLNERWRAQLHPVHRPLEKPKVVQKSVMKLGTPAATYSRAINQWYNKMMETNPNKRISSQTLAERFVPVADAHIETLDRKRYYELACQRYNRVSAHGQGMRN